MRDKEFDAGALKEPVDAHVLEVARKVRSGDKEQLPLNDNTKEWPLIPFPDGWCASP